MWGREERSKGRWRLDTIGWCGGGRKEVKEDGGKTLVSGVGEGGKK